MNRMYALVVTALLLAGAEAHGQNRQQWEWPRTFGGQPDFEFTKEEVLRARAAENTPQGLPAPTAPTLADLLEDEETVDLLKGNRAVSATAAAEGVSGSEVPVLDELTEFELSTTNLPSLTEVQSVDLSEFRRALRASIDRQVENFELKPGRYSLGHLLRGLLLQAVVTSPIKYAVIDGNRYQEGESFNIRARVGPSDVEFLDELASQLPAEGTMPEEQALAYRDVYEEVVAELAARRKSNPESLQKVFPLPVTVVAVEKRKVILNFNGKRHELVVRFAY